MATIRTRCPVDRRDVDVPHDRVVMYTTDREYGFHCPRCSTEHRKAMDAGVETALRGVGVHEVVAEQPGAPPITADEVLDFSIEIRDASAEDVARELGL